MEYNENPKSYDPRMHSVEHILNGTMNKLFKCGRAFSAHIEKKKSKCDYHFDRNLSAEEIIDIENRVNTVIKSEMPIYEEFINREEAESKFNLSRLPEEAGEIIRIIRIGDYDACPCSGPHLNSTKEINGTFKIVSTSFENEVLRVRFKVNQSI